MRTAQRNLISGSARTSTWETGKIIKRMVSVFSTTRTGTSTRVAGIKIRGMGRVLSGSVILRANSEESIPEIGRTIKRKAGVPCFSRRETDTTECGWTVNPMARDV